MMKRQIRTFFFCCAALVLALPQMVSAQPELNVLESEISSVLKGKFQPQEAFEKLCKTGEKNSRAAALCGLCCQRGYGVTASASKAFAWFERAAKAKDTIGCFWAGLALLRGDGVKADPAKGVDYLEYAAIQGNTDAMVVLALVHWEGVFRDGKEIIAVDHPLAERYLRRAVANGNVQGAYLLGNWYFEGIVVKSDLSQARFFYEKAAQSGVADAKAALAELKLLAAKTLDERQAACEELRTLAGVSGRAACVLGNIEPNGKEKIAWYRAAEAKKYAPAFTAHGKFLQKNGKTAEGLILLDRAAAAGDSEAMVIRGFDGARSGRAAGAAFEMLERAARRGNLSAAVKVGRLYLQGRVVPRDERRAYECFRRAAESDNSEAAYFLAICCKEGYGTPKNPEQAVFWAKKSADSGDSFGELLYATMLRDGYGTDRSSRAAFEMMRKSADQGNPHAGKMLSDFLTKVADLPEKESEEASVYVQRAAEKGDGTAALSLGQMYTFGIKPLKRDYALGFKNLQLAAKAGQAAAHAILADYYFNGWGVKRSVGAALKELEAGRRAGDGSAFCKTGLWNLNGIGMKKDAHAAVKFFKEAAKAGSADGELWLGLCKAKGLNGAVDAKGALGHYRKAALMGSSTALFLQAVALKDGVGCKRNPATGVLYLKKAAEMGDGNAMYEYGRLCASGVLVKKDMKEALKWYRKAKDAGNSYGIYELACCYESGRGVEKDLPKAAALYRISAELGNRYAQFMFGRCYEGGIGVEADRYEAMKWYEKSAKNGFIYAGERLKKLKNSSRVNL